VARDTNRESSGSGGADLDTDCQSSGFLAAIWTLIGNLPPAGAGTFPTSVRLAEYLLCCPPVMDGKAETPSGTRAVYGKACILQPQTDYLLFHPMAVDGKALCDGTRDGKALIPAGQALDAAEFLHFCHRPSRLLWGDTDCGVAYRVSRQIVNVGRVGVGW